MAEPNKSSPVLDYANSTEDSDSKWRVGTLHYNGPGLVNVFFWMLWGDFCLNLMDSGVQPTVIPLQLKKYGMSMTAIGALTGTAVEIMSVVMVVVISTWSDRHRGPLGRRMPFMLYSAPPIALCLIAMGFAPQLAHWLQRTMPHLFGTIALGSLVLSIIAVTSIGYRFFDLFPQSVYYYLFTDVIPQKLMGTFTALFRVCSVAGSTFFSYFLLKHAEDNPGMICLLSGGLYLFAFVMMTLMVREGDYPPPEAPKNAPLADRFLDTCRRYIRECYSMGYYWKFYLFTFCFMCGIRTFNNFLIFYGKEVFHGDLDRLGKVNTLIGIVQLVIFFPIGPLVDWIHPFRAGLIGLGLVIVTLAASFFTIHDGASYAIWVTITSGALAVFQGANISLGPRLLPRQQYGQFCSANALLWHVGMMGALPLGGLLIDHFGNRIIFAWFFFFSLAAIVLLYLLYLDWKKLGGDTHYIPPIATAPQSDRTQAVPGPGPD